MSKASLFFLLALFLPVAVLAAPAAGEPTTQLPQDAVLRQAIVGTWLSEKSAGIASVTAYATYREDGSASQILRVKVIFKQAMWVWIKQSWTIVDGTLRVTSERFASNSDQAQVDLSVAHRQLLALDAANLNYRVKDKEQHETKVGGPPADFRKIADELAHK
ncbi:MAG: hypothetical protein PSW75_07200 [bacterium]|nr:hypothetical protein [bacterium]MDI1335676.1 hypothetical protein [Lacunisphaera sp.]